MCYIFTIEKILPGKIHRLYLKKAIKDITKLGEILYILCITLYIKLYIIYSHILLTFLYILKSIKIGYY